ncbi:flavin reductase family protein [Chitinophaga sp. sic0106]|uniref:flavin reductase family protein n=1 Tax=Chitinophaga sp. sic0106 TaxID=2854785 RepID=UPI001C4516CA|nr:flavin reductase family protein [Chitinophaga sp. sic0106]MBV7531040.1 flavin reductase family protein [Chitinophaga sp. sic0106]
MATTHIASVPLEKAYRLINHGPTTLISSRYGETENVMAASWACGLDYVPAKVTVVIDSHTKTRELVEKSGLFVMQVPTVALLNTTRTLGNISMNDIPDKLNIAGVELFEMPGIDVPFVEDCIAWLACKVIPEPHNQEAYDLFIGEVVGAWADTRVFNNGHWLFDTADPELRSIHYISGGQFYAIGEGMEAYK